MGIATHLPVLAVLFLWFLPHVWLINVVRRKESRIMLLMCILLLTAVYVLKPATSDLPRYSVYLSTGLLTVHPYEVNPDGSVNLNPIDSTGEPYKQAFSNNQGFVLLAKVLGTYLPKGPKFPRLTSIHSQSDSLVKNRYVSDIPILVIAVLGLLCCIIAIKNFSTICESIGITNTPVLLYQIPVVIGSLFFLLGSQNIIRQFLGTAVLFLCISFLSRKQYFFSTLFFMIAASIHHWMPVFAVYCFSLWWLNQLLISNKYPLESILTNWRIIAVGFLLGCLAVMIIKVIFLGLGNEMYQYLLHTKPWIPEVKQYGLMDDSIVTGRTGPLKKMAIILALFLVSELIMGAQKREEYFSIRAFRTASIFFLLPLIVYPEVLSRVLFFYFGVEMFYMAWAITSDSRRAQAAAIMILIAHSIAPNGINILVGPSWLSGLLA